MFSFTDTLSFFNGNGKMYFWKTWKIYPEITINRLSESLSLINELPKFERLVILTMIKQVAKPLPTVVD